MLNKPFVNALLASLYITLVSSVMFFGSSLGKDNDVDTILAPIAVLSLFTMSAAVMAYLFLYQPFDMYMKSEKAAAIKFFLTTLGYFALITLAIGALLYFKIS